MQEEFWQNPTYVPLGMYDQPVAFHSYLQDVRDGWPLLRRATCLTRSCAPKNSSSGTGRNPSGLPAAWNGSLNKRKRAGPRSLGARSPYPWTSRDEPERIARWNREFEFGFLLRGVHCETDFRGLNPATEAHFSRFRLQTCYVLRGPIGVSRKLIVVSFVRPLSAMNDPSIARAPAAFVLIKQTE
jgi:hypothetical protein